MILDGHLTWVPHLKSMRHAYQSPLDLLRHLSHTTWGVDRTTFLRYFLFLVHSKLDYSVHVYCTASPRALATAAHHSFPITTLHVEPNVLIPDFRQEFLVVKTLLLPHPLRFFLASKDLANSTK